MKEIVSSNYSIWIGGNSLSKLNIISYSKIAILVDENTKRDCLYKLPKIKNKIIFVLDPMLATGNSSSAAIDLIKDKGAKMSNIKLVSLLATPEGVKNLSKKQKGLHIFTCSLDKSLNKNKFIVPGLGDAGDRYMGT